MKKVLFIATDLGSGGAERQMVSIAIALKKDGYDVSFVCYEYNTFFQDLLDDNLIHVDWVLKQSIIGRLISIRRYVRKGRYDVTVSFLETPNILNCFSSFLSRKKIVITGERSSQPDMLKSVRGHIVAFLMRQSNYIVCNSNNAAKMWEDIYPHFSNRIHVIYNYVSLNEEFCSEQKDPRIRIVVAASYQYLKNPLNVIKAIAMLSDIERSRIRIDWYGNQEAIPSAYSDTERLIKQYGIENTVFLHGATKHIHREMMNSDFVGLFSTVEGLPNAICEAMTLGKPVLMTKVSDYKQLVSDNGFICDDYSSESISAIFRKVLSLSQSEILKLGDNSKRIATTLFGYDSTIGAWARIINNGCEVKKS